MKKLLAIFVAIFLYSASYGFTGIGYLTSLCSGTSSFLYLTDSTYAGGVWTSSNTTVATIASDGHIMALSPGTTTISYTLGSSVATLVFTVNPTPAAIAGVADICVGSSATFTDASAGGTWSISSGHYATVGSASGVVTGVSDGVTDVFYTLPGGCSTGLGVTIGPIPDTWYSLATLLCVGYEDTLSVAATGGTWSSSDVSVATIGATTGILTGVAPGLIEVTYTVPGPCGPSYSIYDSVEVSNTTDPGTISGGTSVYLGGNLSLHDGVRGGTWSSSDPGVASVSSSGYVSGIALGSATIDYSVMGCGGLVSTSVVVTVLPLNSISGNIIFPGGFSGNVKVWLITYNSGTMDLEAFDSTNVSCSRDSVFYQFLGEPTDSFRIKAAVTDTTIATTGFIPTYHSSYFYWHDANVLGHVAGTSDVLQDITMAYGSVAAGPGFIGGNVTTGANRGTSTTIPAVGLLMELTTATGSLVQQTVTDASGNYTFNSLPLGTYVVHPELINYLSTDYTGITISTGAPSATAADFVQHTISHTITPVATGISTLTTSGSSVSVFPNPTTGNLNIQWYETTTENVVVGVTDVAGRVVLSKSVKMTEGSGTSRFDLSGLSNGIYLINIKSERLNYNDKIEILH